MSATDEQVRSNGRMEMTGGKQSTGRKICPSATLSTTNIKWTDFWDGNGIIAVPDQRYRPLQMNRTAQPQNKQQTGSL